MFKICVREFGVDMGSKRGKEWGEYDQYILYEIVKELLKFYVKRFILIHSFGLVCVRTQFLKS